MEEFVDALLALPFQLRHVVGGVGPGDDGKFRAFARCDYMPQTLVMDPFDTEFEAHVGCQQMMRDVVAALKARGCKSESELVQ